jgi:transcriptional regulator with XRE-family HTH domain
MATRNQTQKVLQELGKQIRERRKTLNMTSEKLAWSIDVSKSQLSCIERGLHSPRIDTIIKIAKGLDIHPLELLGFLKRF